MSASLTLLMIFALAEPQKVEESPPQRVEHDDIIVTAESYGQARVESETEFDEAAIAAHGTDSIQQLLERLKPFLSPDGEEPILLINGEPAGSDQSILGYPPEALTALALLKPEAAAEYGFPGGKRVVNLVLKRRFSSYNGDIGYDQPTAGGKSGLKLSASRTAIQGRSRWNVNARISRDSAMLKSKRNGMRREEIFDQRGIVRALGGGELDAGLSELVGNPVDFAGLPDFIAGQMWDLSDFAGRANLAEPIDSFDYESLSPSRRNANLTIGFSRPLGGWNLSLNLNASAGETHSLRGPAMAHYIWRAGDDASPFANDVEIIRPLENLAVLQVNGENKSLRAGLTLNGKLAGWQSNFGVNISRSWDENQLESGVNSVALQKAMDDGLMGAQDPLGREWLLVNRSKGQSDQISMQMSVQKPIFSLPAGDSSFSLNLSGSKFSSKRTQWNDDRNPSNQKNSRQNGNARISLHLPINRNDISLLPIGGNLSLDFNASISRSTGSGGQRQWTISSQYEPWSWLQISLSRDEASSAPDFTQLDGQIDRQINRIFDYYRQEMVDVVWITGGDPDLRRGTRQGTNLRAMIRPFGSRGPSLNVNYRHSQSRHMVMGLPELTPAVEEAFPEKFTRDSEGQLISVDARSINMDRESSSDLGSGITMRWPMEASVDPNQLQLQASINHRMRLTALQRITPHHPVIDLLGGDSGQSRHNISFQFTASRRGVGGTISGNWSNGGRLRSASSDVPSLIFKPPLMLSLSSYMEPERLWPSLKENILFKGLRVSIDLQNLTRAYRRVFRDDGSVPPGYGRDDVDPLGQTIRVSLRKKF